jgi:RNA polymerase-binding transcription factor DksA
MLAVSENDSRQILLINEALERIDDEEYGSCQNCEKEINPKRWTRSVGALLPELSGAGRTRSFGRR